MASVHVSEDLKKILDERLLKNIRMVIVTGECKSHTQQFQLERDVLIHTIQHSRERKVYHLGKSYPSCKFEAVCVERKPFVLWELGLKKVLEV